jgi:hypothetical protein
MNTEFWTWFDAEAAPKLALREVSFRKAFKYLDQFVEYGPLTIVETLSMRVFGNLTLDPVSSLPSRLTWHKLI